MGRVSVAVLVLAALVAAADRVVLKNGGELVGRIVAEDPHRIVLEVGGGTLVLPRGAVDTLERGTAEPAPERPRTVRDEWFAVVDGDVVGWRHVVETRTAARRMIQDRVVRVVAGRIELDRRVVEETAPDGAGLSFLVLEAGEGGEAVVGGQRVEGGLLVRHRSGNGLHAPVLPIEPGWTLPRTALARFLREAEPGARVERRVFDPLAREERTMRLERLAAADGRAPPVFRWHLGGRTAIVETDGSGGVLARSGPWRERRIGPGHAALVRRALAPEPPPEVEEAMMHPLQRARLERPDRERFQMRAGLAVELPSDAWRATAHPRARGAVWLLENDVLLATVEVFVLPLPSPDADPAACLAEARARLAAVVSSVAPAGPPRERTVSGWPARVEDFTARHRGEEVAGALAAVRADTRLVMLVAGVPPDAAGPTRAAFARLLDTLTVAPAPFGLP